MLFGVKEEHHHRQIEVEVEQVDVGVVDGRLPHTDELVGQILDPFQTNNLLVKFIALPSRDAAKHQHQRAVRFAGQRPGLVIVEQPAMIDR